MDRLPNEILVQLFSYLSQNDLINLPFHYTTQGLRDTDRRNHFQELKCWIGKNSLLRIARAAANPFIRENVNVIYLSPFRPILCFFGLFINAPQDEGLLCREHIMLIGRIAKHFKGHYVGRGGIHGDLEHSEYECRLCNIINCRTKMERSKVGCPFCNNRLLHARCPSTVPPYAAQRRFEKSDDVVRLLTFALTRLPNLKEIRIGRRTFSSSDYFEYQPLRLCHSSFQQIHTASHILSLIVGAISASPPERNTLRSIVDQERKDFHSDSNILLLSGLLLRFEPRHLKQLRRSLRGLEVIDQCIDEVDCFDRNLEWFVGVTTFDLNYYIHTPIAFVSSKYLPIWIRWWSAHGIPCRRYRRV